MSSTVTQYRIFIAPPGGLDDVRRAFRDELLDYNGADAVRRQVLLTPVGWEETLGGPRRAQSLINDDLMSCDAFVLVLWDRWGSPPDVESPYSSGCEEEFELASKCLKDPEHPMSDLLVFFQAPETRHLLDPGPQLKRVLAFRQQLEDSKHHLFTVFDELAAFQRRLRKHLAAWVYAHEQGMPLGHSAPERPGILRSPGTGTSGNFQLQEAERLAREGRLTEAEAIFVEAIAAATDPEALSHYGNFLYRVGRLAQAAVMYERMLDLAESFGEREVVVCVKLEVIYRTRGETERAELIRRKVLETYERRELYEQLGRREGRATG